MGVWETICAEFSDLGTTEEWTRALVRLLGALFMGGLLGFEREVEGKAAGLRTHMLVALGSSVIVLGPSLAGMGDTELARIIQGLVAGIGFLGAGTILKLSQEREVRGLTTAAGIWLTAAIGMTAGLGRLTLAFISTLLALGVLSVVARLEARLPETKRREKSDKV